MCSTCEHNDNVTIRSFRNPRSEPEHRLSTRIGRYLDGGAFQSDGQPVAGWTVAQGEDLRGKVVLGQLPALAQVPRTHRVVQSARPQPRSIRTHVDARGAVRVALELPDQRLIVQVPHGDVSVRAAAEANLKSDKNRQFHIPAGSEKKETDLAVRTDGQSVTSRCR